MASINSDSGERARLLETSRSPLALAPQRDARVAFDCRFVTRFALLFRICLLRSVWHWLAIVAITLFTLLFSFTSASIGDLYGTFYSTVTSPQKSLEPLKTNLAVLAAVMILQALLQAGVKLSAGALAVHTRNRVSSALHRRYYARLASYKVAQAPSLENVDQQFTEDVDRFAASYSNVLQKVLQSPSYFNIITASPVFIAVFWLRVSFFMHWAAPFLIVGYFLLSYIVQKFLMSPVVHYVYKQERLEGEFRRIHSIQNQFSEAIAFSRGERVEAELTRRTFARLMANSSNIVKWEAFLYFLSYAFSYLGGLMGYVVVALPLLIGRAGVLDSDFVATATYDLGMLAWGFTQLTLVTADLSELAGYCSRISVVLQFLLEKEKEQHKSVLIRVTTTEDGESSVRSLKLTSLSVLVPKGISLLNDINLEITENTLIQGPSGSGKTALLRIIAGIWPLTHGDITLSEDAMFVPQDAYIPRASLLQAITYPLVYPTQSGVVSIHDLKSHLVAVGLGNLLKFQAPNALLDPSSLSPGERQKILMARVLFHRPKIVFLDEISSSVDVHTEALFYEQCASAGMLIISVGHRRTLRKYHRFILTVDGQTQHVLYERNFED